MKRSKILPSGILTGVNYGLAPKITGKVLKIAKTCILKDVKGGGGILQNIPIPSHIARPLGQMANMACNMVEQTFIILLGLRV